MRFSRAFDDNGVFVEKQDARGKTEEDRHSHDYHCLNPACDCSFHWRRAVSFRENTEVRPATFVKNRSSAHIDNCRYDYERVASRYSNQMELENGGLLIRLNFPLGTAPTDRVPLRRGALSSRQRHAVRRNKGALGVGSLAELVSVIEKEWGSLKDDVKDDLILSYQGERYHWSDLWTDPDHYSKFLEDENGHDTSPMLSVVEPRARIANNPKGKPRFSCSPVQVIKDGKKHIIRPFVVANSEFMAGEINKNIGRNHMLVAARPFQRPSPRKAEETLVYLNFENPRQISSISSNYWNVDRMPPNDRQRQFAL